MEVVHAADVSTAQSAVAEPLGSRDETPAPALSKDELRQVNELLLELIVKLQHEVSRHRGNRQKLAVAMFIVALIQLAVMFFGWQHPVAPP